VAAGRKVQCWGVGELYPTIQQAASYVPPEAAARWWRQRNGAIVGKELAARYGWKEGDTITLPAAKGTAQLVVSHVVTRGTNLELCLWIHYDYAEDLRGARDRYEPVWLIADDAANAPPVMDAARELFHGNVSALTYATVLARQRGESAVIVRLFQAAGLLSLVVVGLVSLAVLTLSLDERRVIFATLRAIGYRRAQIARLVLAESVLLLAPGAALGGLLAWALFGGGLKVAGLTTVRVTPLHAALAAALGVGLGAATAILPGWRAARADVLRGLRDE